VNAGWYVLRGQNAASALRVRRKVATRAPWLTTLDKQLDRFRPSGSYIIHAHLLLTFAPDSARLLVQLRANENNFTSYLI